jgi:hypothetical protein
MFTVQNVVTFGMALKARSYQIYGSEWPAVVPSKSAVEPMGKYDDISPDRLRADLIAFAHLILRLESEEGILASPAELQRLLGDLRQKLFAYEVRSSRFGRDQGESPGGSVPTSRDGSGDQDDPVLRQSLRVVREALRRREEMEREWLGSALDDDEDHD